MKRILIIAAILFSLTSANAQIGEIKSWFNKKKNEFKEKVNQKINETADKIMNKTVSLSDSVKLNKKKKRKNKRNADETNSVEETSAPQQDTSFQPASSPYNKATLVYSLKKTKNRREIVTA